MQGSEIYSAVKHCCDQKQGIVSQCFKSDILRNMPRGYFDNFLLKVNGKLGGLNAVIDPNMLKQMPFDVERTIFIGVDVNHPAETEKITSTVAAGVGSLDPMFSRYSTSIRVQKKQCDEIIKYLKEIITDLLKAYQTANGYLPDNMIIFRDGISEGMHEKVFKGLKFRRPSTGSAKP